jgi:hypothetical protein
MIAQRFERSHQNITLLARFRVSFTEDNPLLRSRSRRINPRLTEQLLSCRVYKLYYVSRYNAGHYYFFPFVRVVAYSTFCLV